MNINRLDHMVFSVRDIDISCDFYARVLGMEAVTFGEGRKALIFGQQKINLHQFGTPFNPDAGIPTPGAMNVCFVTDNPLSEVIKRLESHNIRILEGPIVRSGALGPITSVYFQDPDQNLIEIASYDTPVSFQKNSK